MSSVDLLSIIFKRADPGQTKKPSRVYIKFFDMLLSFYPGSFGCFAVADGGKCDGGGGGLVMCLTTVTRLLDETLLCTVQPVTSNLSEMCPR